MATYLITQASGSQAQWTITHLLAAGAKVHAVVRDPSKAPAVLHRPGVTIFQGESINFEQIYRAAQGCVGVFLNTFPIPGLETQQAQTVVAASRKAGIKTIVSTTTFCTAQKDQLWDHPSTDEALLRKYYVSKANVEDVVRGAGFDAYTILRPAFLHVDYMTPHSYGNYPGLSAGAVLEHGFFEDRTTRMPHTDASDVGRFAAAALQDPARFRGREIELIKDNLTIGEVRDILVRVSGKEVRVKKYTPEEAQSAMVATFGLRFQVWANGKDFSEAVEAAEAAAVEFGMPLTSLEDALTREKEHLIESIPDRA